MWTSQAFEIEKKEIKIAHILQQFRAQLEAENLSKHTIEAYIRDVVHFCQWVKTRHSTPQIAQITSDSIDQYCQMLIGIGRKTATVNRRLGGIRKFTAWVNTIKLTDDNIAFSTSRLPMPARTLPLGLVKDEIKALLDAVNNNKHRYAARNVALIQLFLQTGIRVSEAEALTVDDANVDNQTLSLYIAGTTHQIARIIPVSRSLKRNLIDYHQSKNVQDPLAPFFLSERGTVLNKRGMQHIVQRLAKQAAISRITVSPQTLRDTFTANYLHKYPNKVVELARLLGQQTMGAFINIVNKSG